MGSYERNAEDDGEKTPGDIFALHEFWVFLSEDEKMQLLKVAEQTLESELQTWESGADDIQPLVHRVETLKQSIAKDSDG